MTVYIPVDGSLKEGECRILTPMMTQYFEIKRQYEDFILMYRLGDFYEMFFDDAKKASAELDLALTGRDCGESERAKSSSADAFLASSKNIS